MVAKRARRQREPWEPWELVVVQRSGGYVLHIPCVRCGKRRRHRYWNPHIHAGVCFDCLPNGVRPPRLAPGDPDHRPMALG